MAVFYSIVKVLLLFIQTVMKSQKKEMIKITVMSEEIPVKRYDRANERKSQDK